MYRSPTPNRLCEVVPHVGQMPAGFHRPKMYLVPLITIITVVMVTQRNIP